MLGNYSVRDLVRLVQICVLDKALNSQYSVTTITTPLCIWSKEIRDPSWREIGLPMCGVAERAEG